MTGVIGVVFVLLVWRFLVAFGAAVFEAAGLAGPAARFESRSALVGAGYTTTQSELVVSYPPARRVAGMLVLLGYFGPALILALLGVSFVIPTDEDLTTRAVTLGVLLVGLVLVDRIGLLDFLARSPARALARRATGHVGVEQWIAVGDHAVAAATIPHDRHRAQEVIDALTTADLRILAVEPAGSGSAVIPTGADHAQPGPGDRVIMFGPRSDVDTIRDA